MLIWINGAFGVGKTQTAHELHRRLPDAHVADPELLGFALHKMLLPQQRNDFQDLRQWRIGVRDTLLQTERQCPGPVIVPMTLVDHDYFDEIIGGLRSAGTDTHHYALTAPAPVIHARLKRRAAHVAGRIVGVRETWAMQQTGRCVDALTGERFATRVETAGRRVDDVVEEIAVDVGLELVRPRLNVARYQLRRAAVGLRHVRL
ncbi:AAA family ATPase [Gordonia sp. ABSL11-1]|uniref:AAA family ATPase n=1 Tax=Gordonia sp. ABSL11-1 TaxID=3053924 RepID=UPI0025744F44|nr:AAA family ATPase [Gordonia sp. ABSL11-1]MDL9948697.1 AAA family ATPase [Gordonia sp. ABSL11-1]